MTDPAATATVDPSAELEAAEDEVTTSEHDALVEEDLLVEDVSIDGMCGVY